MKNDTIRFYHIDNDTTQAYDTSNIAEADSGAIATPSIDTTYFFTFDSVFHKPSEANKPVRSLFANHTLAVKHRTAIPIANNATKATTLVSLFLVVLLATIYLKNRIMSIREIATSTFSSNGLTHLMREQHFGDTASNAIVTILIGIAATLIGGYYIAPMGRGMTIGITSPYILYPLLFLTITLYYIVRNAVIRLIGKTFDAEEVTKGYITSNYVFDLIASLVAIPVYILLVFSSGNMRIQGGQQIVRQLIYLSPLIIIILMRIIRGIAIILTQANTTKLHLIYYLCIVEIVPILVIGKALI